VKPFAWFTPKVSDTEYAPKFQAVLGMVRPEIDLIVDRPPTEDWEEAFAWEVARLERYLEEFARVHNDLVDIKPRRQLFSLHRALIKVSKGYGYTLLEHAQMLQALLDDDMRRHAHQKKHGMQWDALTRGWAKGLIRRMEKLLASHPETYELLVGSRELPEGVEDCADDSGVGVALRGGTVASWTP